MAATFFGIAHIGVNQFIVPHALMSQLAFKVLGSDKINFRILRIIRSLDKEQITIIVQQAIRLGYRPKIEKILRYVT